jgi:hypothetical protein
MLLSADITREIVLGPQTGFNDQPYVEVELLDGQTGLGPYDNGFGIYPYNYLLLDTGANSVMIVSDAAKDLHSNGYRVEGTYHETGVGGVTEFDVSAPYRFDVKGSDGVTHTLPQTSDGVRILSAPSLDLAGLPSAFGGISGIVGMPGMVDLPAAFGGISGIVGMPGMVDYVTSLDFSHWKGATDLLEMQPTSVTFADGADALPPGDGHRYSVAIDNRVSFDVADGLPPDAPAGAPLPAWAPIPFMTGVIGHKGVSLSGDFLVDTGAQMSMISQQIAFEAGLDANGDGSLLDDAIFTLPIAGVGGSREVPVLVVEEFRLPTEEGVDLVWRSPEIEPLVTITPTLVSTEVSEGGGFDTYEVALAVPPQKDVTVTLTSIDGQLTAVDEATRTKNQLVFTSLDWETPQLVRVTANNDISVEGAHTGTIVHAVSSEDPDFHETPVASLTAHIADDDSSGPGVRITPNGATDVGESGQSAAYEIVLTSPPSANVRIALSDPTGQVATTDDNRDELGSLLFTTSNWSTPQVVHVVALDDDLIEGSHTGTIVHTVESDDLQYRNLAVGSLTASVADNDQGLGLLALDIAPGIDGVFGVDLLTSGIDFSFDLASFEFTVEGAPYFDQVHFDFRDMAAGTGTIYFDLNSSYDVATPTGPGALIEESDASTRVSEGGPADEYTFVLTSEPTHDVEVTVTADDQLSVSPTKLVFTAENWHEWQTVSVEAKEDDVVEGPHTGRITHAVESDDPRYHAIPMPGLTVAVTDNDSPVLAITEADGSTYVSTEVVEGGGTDGFTVALKQQPVFTVAVALVYDSEQLTVEEDDDGFLDQPGLHYLIFDSTNWDQPVSVSVAAVDDQLTEGPHSSIIDLGVGSLLEPEFNGTMRLTVNITDDDAGGLRITESDDSTQVSEDGAGDEYTVSLTREPSHDVEVTLDYDEAQLIAKDDGGATIRSLVFTTSNWSNEQTVHVAAVDDDVVEGTQERRIVHSVSSDDAAYVGLPDVEVTVEVADNDSAGLLITETDGSTEVVEGGATDTYSVALTSRPIHDVTVFLSNTDWEVVAVDENHPTSGFLVFTPSEWQTAQTVRVTAVDDDVVEESLITETFITHDAFSRDPNYQDETLLSVRVADNDAPVARFNATLVRQPTTFDNPTTGEVDELPASEPWIDEWTSFWVELWVSTSQADGTDLDSASVDLGYDTDYFTATEIELGRAFAADAPNLDDDGWLDDIGGSTGLSDVGEGGYALLARVSFECSTSDVGVAHDAMFDPAAGIGGPGLALADGHAVTDDVDPAAVETGSLPETEVWPVTYDVDDDGHVGFGDFAYLATAFNQDVGDPNAPFARACDYDYSGHVDFGDVAFFAENFQRGPGDPIVYPSNYPEAWRVGGRGSRAVITAARAAAPVTERQSGLAVDEEWEPSDLSTGSQEAVVKTSSVELLDMAAAYAWSPAGERAAPLADETARDFADSGGPVLRQPRDTQLVRLRDRFFEALAVENQTAFPATSSEDPEEGTRAGLPEFLTELADHDDSPDDVTDGLIDEELVEKLAAPF